MRLCEDEVYFILICPLYSNMRQVLLNPMLIDNPNLSELDQIIYLVQFCRIWYYELYTVSMEYKIF